jgi:hypothetical protein
MHHPWHVLGPLAVAMRFDADDCMTEWGVLRGQPPTWIEQFRAWVKW